MQTSTMLFPGADGAAAAPSYRRHVEVSAFLSKLAAKKAQDANALQVYRWALDLDPENADAMNQVGRLYMASGDYEEALGFFDMACGIAEQPGYMVNGALALTRLGRYEPAALQCKAAIALFPTAAPAYIQLSAVLQLMGGDDDAFEAIESGIAVNPANHELLFARSLMRQRRGDLAGALADYEHRPSRVELLAKLDEYPEWLGQNLDGKTLLICPEQGLGDQIQQARYLDAGALGCAYVVLYTRPELARLFEPLADVILTSDRELALVNVDYWVGIGSLPLRCAGDNTVPATNYLAANHESQEYLARLMPEDGRLRVGIAWAGNPQHAKDSERSIPFEMLQPLLDIPGIDFFSLQHGVEQKPEHPKSLAARCHDLADTAGAIANLDLVITIDSAMLHLAGALGTPVWGFMYAPGDPRWGSSGSDTALYPWARLFRQPTPGDWTTVIEQATAALSGFEHCRERTGQPAPPPLLLNAPCRYGRLSFHPNDHYVGRALHLYGEYSQSEAELLGAALQPGDTVVEAGANIGALTAAIADRVGPAGSVIAFEPQPHYFALLNWNVGGRENVIVREEALGATMDSIEISGIVLDKIHAPGWKGGGLTHLVFQTVIDELSVNPALIKIDVDGQELDILKGAEATIQRARPLLYVEDDKPARYPDLLPWIEARGYRIYQHYAPLFNPNNYAGYRVNVFGNIVSAMIFCVPKERFLARDFPERFGLQRLA